ncbi:Magnesium-transporting ATPase%2C P-type 1 [uncultured Clostridium sp.]|uniref:magnesium-translocating P-type ATPase n=1 Tax=uncultured Clostridium sp. TaxID=59620 RepID=UPI000822D298|nr:magnesium-translocating P-type ATPase [uncultured Clostridium sp.]SCI73074.1 Magnesium-transporting ATPase%2C P-type 1 [uncultured Clostridium sp.]
MKERNLDMFLLKLARTNNEYIFEVFNSSVNGLSEVQVEGARERYGNNKITHEKNDSFIKRFINAFINPFTVVLLALSIISVFTDIIIPQEGEKNFTTVLIIFIMVTISGVLRFIQERRSNNAAEKLNEMVKTTATVVRNGEELEVELSDIVCGDIVYLSAGDMVPADVKVIQAKDLFISQSALTGESEAVEKLISLEKNIKYSTPLECPNLAFMGSNVISGTAICIVVATGDNTIFGNLAKSVVNAKIESNFEKGVNSVSWLLIRFMMIMAPIVLFINGYTKGDWAEALLFALSIAVGLTPEMLPMIVTTSLAKGAVEMAKKKTVIKNLNSIQNFGAMDVLCTDKTGTLTKDKVVLEYHLDIHGNEDERVLRHAFMNSYYQTGLKNLMDIAVIRYTEKLGKKDDYSVYEKVDEIPFDFQRRRMSVVLKDSLDKTQLITKGAVEEMLSICKFTEYKGIVTELTDEIRREILDTVDKLNDDGMRVIAVAQKTNPSVEGVFSVKDESDMVLMGYIAFLDPPKETTKDAIKALKENGVTVKVLTGDNEKVTRCICRQVGLEIEDILMGSEIEDMSDEMLALEVETTSIFAKLSPQQKARIVRILRGNGHVVGFMGDGINDASAMKNADVGISVDTAVDIAKESADIILLEKDLNVLENGVIEGRRTFGNMIKYIKMTASSNFGNMFSVLIASAFLPFLPMMSIQLIFLNLIYDLSCVTIPWDNMDKEFLTKPKKWDASSIGKFMIWIGPTSSAFDIVTYLVMYFIICPMVCGGDYNSPGVNQVMFMALFNAGWFVESLWTQTLVVHMIRTEKIPFIQSRASLPVIIITTLAIFVGTIVPYTKLGVALGMYAMPALYFIWLFAIILAYMCLVTLLKKLYIKKYGELL